MSKTLAKRFQEITELKLGMKVTAVKIYRVQDDSLGDNKVISAVAAKEIDLHRLVHVAMTDRLYGKYKGYYVVVEAHDGDVYKVWIKKQEDSDETD